MSDGANENAPKGDESLGARVPQSNGATKLDESLGTNRAATAPKRKPSFDPATVRAFADVGLALFPLDGKRPTDPAWTRRNYDGVVEARRAEGKRNLGVQLTAEVVVLDVDPRNGGDDSLDRLKADLGIDLDDYPQVQTGGGGLHVYMWKDSSLKVPKDLAKAGYPGLDLKTKGGQVVAPGSIHPDTGVPYVGVDMARLAFQAPIPEALVELIRREKPAAVSGQCVEPGLWTPDELAQNLSHLDPDDFDSHEPWLEVMMSAHYATAGEGLDAFAEWSELYTGDNASSREQLEDRWRSLSIKQGGITHKVICRLLHERGVRVHDELPPEQDFDVVEDESTVDRAAGAKRRKRDWKVLSIDDLLNMPPPRWIVEGTLQEQSAAVLFGPPGEGKSFVALDIALCMAAGIAWHGHAVVPGNVLYIAAEGAAGLGVRVQAWIKEHGLLSAPNAFQLFTDELTFAEREMADDFLEFVADEAEVARPRLIVVDTLSQTSTGFEENSNTDMARYFKRVQGLVNRTGATVLVIHHTGKESSKGERGAFAIRGNIDTSIEAKRVEAEGKRYVALHARKQKNDEERQITELEMVRREFVARDGSATSSLVLVPSTRSVAMSAGDFLSDELRLHDWIAKQMGTKDSVQLGELLKPLEAAGIIAGKERTLRTKLTRLIGEGFEDAKACTDGTRIWLERDKKNAATGPITIHKAKETGA